jgi:hypothetical protein
VAFPSNEAAPVLFQRSYSSPLGKFRIPAFSTTFPVLLPLMASFLPAGRRRRASFPKPLLLLNYSGFDALDLISRA